VSSKYLENALARETNPALVQRESNLISQATPQTQKLGEIPALDLRYDIWSIVADHKHCVRRYYLVRFFGFESSIRCFFHSCLRLASTRLYTRSQTRHAIVTARAAGLWKASTCLRRLPKRYLVVESVIIIDISTKQSTYLPLNILLHLSHGSGGKVVCSSV
jgi:hypothetical protein